ncbi:MULTISPECIES: class II aldolase/adducin family protein [unclassified Beijerinckia]|uniref:class II aldolase/adducin family protein n=1 Tax=unclassified Beijerinckia TaxID=2638183 RepID=UPI00089AC566|nr:MULTISPECIES: class II aldolase/adducin family protein [unclassified Beijerinckia]MDH7799401.1 ribulose-5-phosphate 4-epimerase/fuculose-1-phosphate aldolase [Beijerinckia sp. GAS462]SED49120.1 HCOMODA/2-hydroxy-3-carboxy-muconic semialdehyde decarboxylase [Beijerinckia sp. 28-YEA-48]
MRLNTCPCCAAFAGSFAASPSETGAGAPIPKSGGPLDRKVLEEFAAASRILADQGVVDAFGHVTLRHPHAPDRFLMARALAPALVTADDIMEFDLDSVACENKGRSGFLERFIHGQIFKARPDVMAVVHSHSQSVIPYGLVDTPLRAMFHNAAFLAEGVPVFDISKKFGATDMLVGNNDKGVELASVLGDKPVVLMRAHGSVAVGPSLQTAVFRAVYTEVSARMQTAAMLIGGGGHIAALSKEEGALADAVNLGAASRAWDLWKRRVGAA